MHLSPPAPKIFDDVIAESERGLTKIRSAAQSTFSDSDKIIIGVNGSYARREATVGSDVDLFFLYRDIAEPQAKEMLDDFRSKLESSRFKNSTEEGPFTEPLLIDSIYENIGGKKDDNTQITRRMLLLLEGEWIFNKELLDSTRNKVLERYIHDNLTEKQISLFLLNDVIRYWRTICIDFEHKVKDRTAKDKKDYCLRLIKLRFSRKLLFFAGVLAISTTYGLSSEEKIKKLIEVLAKPAIERVRFIAGERAVPAIELYADFLAALNDETMRSHLAQADIGDKKFENLRSKSREFDREVLWLLNFYCDGENPTFRSLIM